MFLKKKWFSILFAVLAISLITACGTGKEKSNGTSQDTGAVQESSDFKFMPLSDALEKYPLWYKVEGDPHNLTRNSELEELFVFDKGTVKQYRVRSLKLEDLIDMTDDEIIETVIDRLYERDEDYEEPEPIEYTLDITLDEVGKDSQFINLETEPETLFSVIDETAFQTIFDTPFSGLVFNNEDRSDWDDHIITRVEDESLLFTLDDSNTKKSVVTIEKAAELEELREAQKEKERIAEEERMALNPTDDEIEELYKQSCAACHGEDLSGSAGPQLINVGTTLSENEMYDIIVNGKGAMPGGIVDNNQAEQIAEWLSEMR